MKRLTWLLFGALALTGSAVAVDVNTSFKDADKDKSGYISVEESKEVDVLSQHWYKFDANNDGQIDTSEFSAFEEADIDTLEPYALRHDWYGSVGSMTLH